MDEAGNGMWWGGSDRIGSDKVVSGRVAWSWKRRDLAQVYMKDECDWADLVNRCRMPSRGTFQNQGKTRRLQSVGF